MSDLRVETYRIMVVTDNEDNCHQVVIENFGNEHLYSIYEHDLNRIIKLLQKAKDSLQNDQN